MLTRFVDVELVTGTVRTINAYAVASVHGRDASTSVIEFSTPDDPIAVTGSGDAIRAMISMATRGVAPTRDSDLLRLFSDLRVSKG